MLHVVAFNEGIRRTKLPISVRYLPLSKVWIVFDQLTGRMCSYLTAAGATKAYRQLVASYVEH